MTKARILIVEDEVIIAMEIESSLQNLGYEVISIVNSGDKAIQKAEDDNPDLILMDIRIQGDKDGIETAEIIRIKYGIPVIFSTAYLDEERIERAKITMPFGYVLKPIQERDLKVTLEMALYVAKVDAERRKAEQLMQQTLDATTDGSWTWNFKTYELFFSNKYYAMLGYEPNEFEANFENWSNLIHPDDHTTAITAAEEYLKTKPDLYDNEFRMKTKQGQYRWIRAKAKVVERDENGEAVFMIGNHEDITERKRQEKDLIFKSMVLDQISDNVTLTDMNGIITYVNKAVERTVGSPKTEIVGSPTAIYGEDSEKGATQNEIVEKTKKDGVYRCEVVNVDVENNEHIMDCRTQVVRDENGNPIALCGIATDITESKRLEEQLKKEHQRFKDLSELLPDVVFELDMQFNLSYANEKAFKRFGYTKEDFKNGINASQIIAPESREKAIKNISRLLSGEKLGLQEYVATAKDGSRFPVLIHSNQIVQDGSVAGLRGILIDMTERKQAKEKTRFQSQILDCIEQAIIATDLEGQVLYFNKAAENLYQWSAEEALKMNIMNVIVPQMSQEQAKDIMETIGRGGKWSGEFLVQRKDGTTFIAYVTDSPILDEKGEPIGIVGISREA